MNMLKKMVYDKLIKVIINTSGLEKVIIDIVIQHHKLLELIISDHEPVFTSKF